MTSINLPTHIFLIPYRDRESELEIWYNNMKPYLDNQLGDGMYEVFVIHQCDDRMFNRGALCNIGFLYAKSMYPDKYKNIQFIIHDVDIYPIKVEGKEDIIKYNTMRCEARHPYGVLRPQFGGTLGGICIMYGEDYERINGMPNYFGWGGEDVALSRRCRAHKININEERFINRRTSDLIVDPESHVSDAKQKIIRVTDKLNLRKALTENSLNNINGLNNLQYTIKEKNHIFYDNNNDKCNDKNWNMINIKFDVN